MISKSQVKQTKPPKKIRGKVMNIEKDYLKYSLPSGKKEYPQGARLEILVGNKTEIAKLPDTHIDLLKKDLLGREIEYTYTKNAVYTYRGVIHNWQYEIKTVDEGNNFNKTYNRSQ